MSYDAVKSHQVLYVVPHARFIRQRHVKLSDINTCILFTTPQVLRDGHMIRGQILCHVVGEDHLDLETTMLARTRLRQPDHECPALGVDFSRYLWAAVDPEQPC